MNKNIKFTTFIIERCFWFFHFFVDLNKESNFQIVLMRVSSKLKQEQIANIVFDSLRLATHQMILRCWSSVFHVDNHELCRQTFWLMSSWLHRPSVFFLSLFKAWMRCRWGENVSSIWEKHVQIRMKTTKEVFYNNVHLWANLPTSCGVFFFFFCQIRVSSVSLCPEAAWAELRNRICLSFPVE